MKNNHKFWWAFSISIGIAAVLGLALVVLFWHQSIQQNKPILQELFTDYGHYIITTGLIVIAWFGFMLARVFQTAIIPMNKLSEEVELIHSVNPAHRIQLEGGFGLMQLVEKINAGAEQYENMEKSVFERVHVAKAELEEEKNILAAIMAELPEAVLVCNKEGMIILYNSQAKRYFSGKTSTLTTTHTPDIPEDTASDRQRNTHLGIGRSIFGVIDENIIQHALGEIRTRLKKNEENVTSNFVITDRANRLLRAEAAPILNPQKEFSGFIIIFNDITQGLRLEARAEFLLRSFQQKIRHSVASIKSAIEVLQTYPEIDTSRRNQLREIIHTESNSLEQLIQHDSKETFIQTKSQWPLVPVSTIDLLEMLQKKADEQLGVALNLKPCIGKCWVKIDTYSMILSLLFVLERVREEIGEHKYSCQYSENEDIVFLEFTWEGTPLRIEKLRQWETMQLNFLKEGMPLHLKEVLDYNNADIWSSADLQQKGKACLRIYLPAFRPQEQDSVRHAAILPASRPEFYDFDLFHQPGQTSDLDNRLLKDLVYTVFDTETTGLDPAGGDEIVSIGALRIVNTHILTDEPFDQMVNPQRDIPMSATEIHGISNVMVQSQPIVDAVLPAFFKYTEDTIIVAHNAAFDMRMLQTYEYRTGIQFVNPVLDTLLLSAIVHSAQEDQTLSSIAGRLGVSVVDRHTAIGDAMMTAKIFIRMIPLLEKKGIQTLGEAREASEKTYYARMKF
ncbi:MAG: exonuclease domain-containing protein [Desulfobacterales bacterium]|nr:exonuclease domain-containing protein [Desulfobacterales bacterium]MDX2511256.1 exonuclease domain-containing protein [Desulfobacterales bacterium]